MATDKVVVTGLGVISPNGIGKAAFFEAIFKGVSGIKPISLFDTQEYKAKLGGEISGFKPEEILGPKGLRTLDRSTKLISSAAKLALDDAGFEVTEENALRCGVAVGTTLGSLSSVSNFDKDALVDGPRYVNPAFFPNTVINSPASQVSIRFNIKGFNATISTGFCSSLDAINYAVDALRDGRADIVLAGGVEELCVQTFLGFYRTRFLAGLDDPSLEISCPFDKRRNGIIFAEGAGLLVLENLASAKARKAKIYAEVKGYGTGFDAYKIRKYDPRGGGLIRSMRLGITSAGLVPSDIDYICAGANSTKAADAIETGAIKEVFGRESGKVPVSSLKSMIGESFSASGGLQAIASVAAIERQMIPPAVNYVEKDPACALNHVTGKAREAVIDNVLINSFGPSGCNSSLMLSKFKG